MNKMKLYSRIVTPATKQFRMPAEWEEHEGTWLSWPKDPVTWPDRVPEVELIFIEMIYFLSFHEKVFLLVDSKAVRDAVLKRLKQRGVKIDSVIFYLIKTADSWTRDYGPNFLVREIDGEKELAMNHWIFNAWGGKYPELMGDTLIPKELESILEIARFVPDMVLEGGSIDVNGQGVVLTTEQCLLNPNRNPRMTREQIENRLRDFLNVSQVVWLGDGIEGDDTDGHVDDITRFVGPHTIVTAVEEDPADFNYAPLKKNLEQLKKVIGPDGQKFDLVALPMPGFIGDHEGRLPASYANFYIANTVVLAPVFGHKNDKRAVAILKELFPSREVVPINCEPLVYGFGAIHCVTQQQPKV